MPSSGSQTQMSSPSQSGTPAGAAQSSSPGASQSPSAGSPSQGQGAAGGHSVEDELQLTDAQKAKLQPIIQEEMSQIETVRNDQSMSMDQKVAKVREIKQTEFPKIQAILTPEQQKKLSDMQERARQQQQGAAQGSQGSSAPTGSQPPK